MTIYGVRESLDHADSSDGMELLGMMVTAVGSGFSSISD